MDTDYWHSLDRKTAKDIGVSTDFISVSTHPFKEQLDELKAKIFSGTKNVEISFLVTKSGSRAQGQTVPEHYGKEEREELRQLAKINEIELTTHSPPQAPPLSGFSGERGFSPEVQQDSLEELKKTIEFAAEVARGGPITVHTQEFPRPIFEAGEKFEAYEKEREKAPIYFVDKRTGKLGVLDRQQEIPVPIGGFENPERDKETRELKGWNYKKISDFEKEACEKKQDTVKYVYEQVYKKELEFKEIEAKDATARAKRLEQEDKFLKDVIKGIEKQAKTDPSAANYYAIKWVKELEAESRERLAPRQGSDEYKDFLENPIKYLKEIEDRTEKAMKATYEAADARKLEIEERKRQIDKIEPIQDFALGKTAETIAKAATYAYEKERALNLERPLIIAPENVFTETYGSQPRELKEIIIKSRDAFAKKLVDDKIIKNEQEAKKIAEERIKATFDIGHVNTWRKYFKGTDEEFRSWILKEVDGLAKQGFLGHVHINDNFGYEDVHITPGQGNAPIKEFVDKIMKEGYTGKMVIEAGNQRQGEQWQVLTGAWKTLNSPIYKIDSHQTWTDIQGSYFGRTGSPTYLVGDLAPSKDWTLWSETQLE